MPLGIGKILSSAIKKNLDAEHETQLLQVEIDEKTKDVQTMEELHIPGYQYKPHPQALGIFNRIHEAWKVLTGVDDKVVKDTSILPGESKLYSSDSSGTVIAVIKMKVDGTILIENGTASITFDLLTHTHLGNNGYNTGPPNNTGAGVPIPANAPTYDSGDNTLDLQTSGIKNVGSMSQNVEAHTHTQGNDSNGDTEVPTNPPA